jgi:hypothetical protein
MKHAPFFVLAAAVPLYILSTPRNALALGPVDIEVAARVGGGTDPVSLSNNGPGPTSASQPNAAGFGVGARAGASIDWFYGGLSFMDYLGTKSSDGSSLKSVLYGVEAGFNIHVPFFTLRPELGIGGYSVTQSSRLNEIPTGTSTESYTAGSVYVEPGLTAIFSFGLLLLGADANYLFFFPSNGFMSESAFTAHGQVGIKF